MATEGTLERVNKDLQSPVTVHRFRPNIVISGPEAFGEVFFYIPVYSKLVSHCTTEFSKDCLLLKVSRFWVFMGNNFFAILGQTLVSSS